MHYTSVVSVILFLWTLVQFSMGHLKKDESFVRMLKCRSSRETESALALLLNQAVKKKTTTDKLHAPYSVVSASEKTQKTPNKGVTERKKCFEDSDCSVGEQCTLSPDQDPTCERIIWDVWDYKTYNPDADFNKK